MIFASKKVASTFSCLADGPTTASLIKQMGEMCKEYPVIKIKLEEDDYWSDLVSFHKGHDNQAGQFV